MGRGFGRAKEQEPESYEIERRPVARYQPDHREGLTRAQAAERMAAGWSNIPVDPPAQTVKEIIHENVFTYFNLVFTVLAVLLCLVGSFRNLTFMPVIIMRNKVHGNESFCNLNEGIGKVMRFGAYDEEVLARHRWMMRTLGPVLSAALRSTEEGIDITSLVAQAITMGDEFHQRNIAASALLMRSITVPVMKSGMPLEQCEEVLDFLARTDQFFLNVMMAYCKCVMDAAAEIEEGSIVTAMTRNGRDFGIRVSGLGKRWFTADVNTPVGLFFTGYTQDDANPDIGDSAITETFGVGGAAMVAAPGVTRFVGAGGFQDALRISNEMQEIYVDNNPLLLIPSWDFRGAPLGLDIRKVVETGITPLINTGIAHKLPGIGQVGAGTVRAPLDCFVAAFEALAQKLELND